MNNNIILTGLPRSGTTLSCHLLNKLRDCVALAEPMDPTQVDGSSDAGFVEVVKAFFLEQRQTLLVEHTAISKANSQGIVPDNSFDSARPENGLRPCVASSQKIAFHNVRDINFRLIIKHPGMFTAKLSTLIAVFPCYALVRNPLALLLSWSSVDANITHGRVPMAEKFDSNLRAKLSSEPDRLSRQLIILSYFFEMYRRVLPVENVIRYEDLIASGGRTLSAIESSAVDLREALELKNTNHLYDRFSVIPLAERLLACDGAWNSFYSKDSITRLCDLWVAN